MARWNGRVVYIDGFADRADTVWARTVLRLLCHSKLRGITHSPIEEAELVLHLRNEDAIDRCRHLKSILDELSPTLPSRIKWSVVHGKFDEHLTKTFKIIDTQKEDVAPTLVFIDPFGFSHTPFKTISNILKNSRCEVLVNFMYEEVNRFLSVEKHSDDYDQLCALSGVPSSTHPSGKGEKLFTTSI